MELRSTDEADALTTTSLDQKTEKVGIFTFLALISALKVIWGEKAVKFVCFFLRQDA